MNVLLYVNVVTETAHRLRKVIEAITPRDRIKTCSNINSLIRRLRQPRTDLKIAVLFAPTREDLEEILSIDELLSDLRIIVILPDREEETVFKGHMLRPRLLTYVDSPFEHVGAVLKRMLEAVESGCALHQ